MRLRSLTTRERERVTPAKYRQVDFSESKKSDSVIYDSKINDSNTQETKSKEITNPQDLQAKDLGKVVAKGYKDAGAQSRKRYQSSAGEISRGMLESNPSGNGDITSILKILPNVQFDSSASRSTQGGEIDPANISISGGLFYQNNFQLDGFNINNDLNPATNSTNYNPVAIVALPGQSQGLNIDSSLIDSLNVLDSNVSAAYGGFTGGVVAANTKRATKEFGANISYQITQANANPNKFSLTNFFINNEIMEDFLSSNAPMPNSYEPVFHKHLIRASMESKFHEKAGIVASFTTTQSFIPLGSYGLAYQSSVLDDSTKMQKRQSYNLFLKGHYDALDNLTLEAQYAYMPQYNNYFIRNTKDSHFDMLTGGHQVGLKALWHNAVGHFTAQSNFNYLDNSRTNSANSMKMWHYSTSKNWNPNKVYNSEGGYGNVDSKQIDFNIKVTQEFEPIKLGFWENTFNLGADLGYVNAYYERREDAYVMNPPLIYFVMALANGMDCYDEFCSYEVVDISKMTNENAARPAYKHANFAGNIGQWQSRVMLYKAGKINLNNFTANAWLEDDIHFDLGKGGEINTRLGVRLDYDTYMSKATFAPRFSLNYITPAPKEYKTQLTFGANRYYGRNLFAYKLLDARSALQYTIGRDSPSKSWDSILENPANNKACRNTAVEDCYSQSLNDTKFNQLKAPYADELMGGIAQNIYDFTLGIKYIYRKGKDEVRRSTRSVLGLEADSTRIANYYVYTNAGQSTTNVISVSLQNHKPLETFGIKHYYLFAFDWTNVVRNYADYSASMTNPEIGNDFISWGGKIIRYSERPATNFVRPYTLRLNTTHNFEIMHTKWTWNNFLRLRSPYNAMVSVSAEADKDSYNGTKIDTFRILRIPFSFSWDMRVGFEVDIYKGNTLYVNVDIYNVLNNKNLTVYNSASNGQVATTATQTAIPIYELGRQFWFQMGYKF